MPPARSHLFVEGFTEAKWSSHLYSCSLLVYGEEN
uniref:Uncharacterized protein n=1 Tax=Utricularia reniformis TaxID=192314 RepID=A0A1Y0B0I4_9LAMI|nr:hypothetical protein AEK19_MT0634 [Utricularia reniformis]ART30888.1 hypothetical protein AEK19_MT0634 [Utricularia reniformis]